MASSRILRKELMRTHLDPKFVFGLAIREERIRQSLSQKQLASMIGTGKAHIWRVEDGKVATTIVSLAQIAEAVGVRVSALIRF